MKTRYWILIIVILIIGFFMVFRLGGEDSWIKNERGEYVKHGVPLDVPDYVKEQQDAIICANRLYQDFLDSERLFQASVLGLV